MITIKLPYTSSKSNKEIILKLMKQQNSCMHHVFNKIKDSDNSLQQKELTAIVNSMNNIDNIDSWFKQSAIYTANAKYRAFRENVKQVVDFNKENPSNKKRMPHSVIFGGKKLFIERTLKKIKRRDFKLKRLEPLVSIGETRRDGNRKYVFDVIENNLIMFYPNRQTEIEIRLPKLRKNYKEDLCKIQNLMDDKRIPVQLSIDLSYVYITYDESNLSENVCHKIDKRFMAIDMNPNEVGYSVIDWVDDSNFSVVTSGILSIKEINDKQLRLKITSSDPKNIYLNNKREHEIFEVSKELVKIAKHYQVSAFGLEDLDLESRDHTRGKKSNRLINNFWCYSKFSRNLIKRLVLNSIKYYKVPAAYSSFIGNLMYRDYPDPVAASIEINRRVYLSCLKDTLVKCKTKYHGLRKSKIKSKPVRIAIFPEFKVVKDALIHALEVMNKRHTKFLTDSDSWKDLYSKVKHSRLRYRVSLNSFEFKVFSLSNRKSLVQNLGYFSII